MLLNITASSFWTYNLHLQMQLGYFIHYLHHHMIKEIISENFKLFIMKISDMFKRKQNSAHILYWLCINYAYPIYLLPALTITNPQLICVTSIHPHLLYLSHIILKQITNLILPVNGLICISKKLEVFKNYNSINILPLKN